MQLLLVLWCLLFTLELRNNELGPSLEVEVKRLNSKIMLLETCRSSTRRPRGIYEAIQVTNCYFVFTITFNFFDTMGLLPEN